MEEPNVSLLRSVVPALRCPCAPLSLRSVVPALRCPCAPLSLRSVVPALRCPCAPLSLRSVVPALRCPCAPLSLRSVVACLSFALFSLASLLAASAAQAGTYTVAYSGGMVTIPPSESGPYFYDSNASEYTGFGTAFINPDAQGNPVPLNAGAAGTLTATFTWQPAYPSEPPPAEVIVEQTCTASAGYSQPNNTALSSCDDGLGQSAGPTARPISCTGTTHTVQSPASDGSVLVTCSPSAKLSGSSGTQGAGGPFIVDYSASVTPVTVNLSGVKVDTDGSLKLLTGQQVEASLNLNGNPGDLSNFDWTVEGDGIYGAYLPSESAAQIQPIDTSESSVFFYDKTDQDTIAISCTATITFPDGTTSNISAVARMIKVLKPVVTECDINSIPGINYTPNSLSNTPIYYAAREIWAPIIITVPDPFGSVNGSACIAQIIRGTTFQDTRATSGEPAYIPQMEATSDEITHNTWVPVSSGLDCGYPYPFTDTYSTDGNGNGNGSVMPSHATSWSAPGTGAAEDNPSVPCTPSLVDGDIGTDWNASGGQDDFYTWIMYSPDGSSWVPLSKISWTFLGNANLSGDVWQGGGGTSSSGASATDEFPEWDLIVPFSGTGYLRYGPVQQ